jgi:hypothetical protein
MPRWASKKTSEIQNLKALPVSSCGLIALPGIIMSDAHVLSEAPLRALCPIGKGAAERLARAGFPIPSGKSAK